MSAEKMKIYINGEYRLSKTEEYVEVVNPSTGEVDGLSPCATKEEVEESIENAHEAFKLWSRVPVVKRVQVLHKVRQLLIERLDELTMICAREHGKVWDEAKGDVLKAIEGTELAISAPSLIMGESLMDASIGYDTVSYRESLGVFAGVCPFNFPAMIPMGWMAPCCIAAGNAMVLKVSSSTPRTAMAIADIYKEAGLPDGVLNIISCKRTEAEIFLTHPKVKGITFVGTTKAGKHIYSVAASHGKRVQALCEAKNHALVMEDAPIERTAAGIINAAYGCAGERCMALPVVVVHESIADKLVEEIKKQAQTLKVGPAYDKASKLGPVVNKGHKERIEGYIAKGIEEGATLVLDGRGKKVEGFENGFYLGPTIFDHVTEDMVIGREEIFGPVLCVKRVKSFEEGLKIMNNSPFANGSVIFTQSGYYAREFARNTDGGMVGINVGIPVPIGVFSFTGHKDSFFGDLHCLGKDAFRFYTEQKTVTTKWFTKEEAKSTKVSTWDGTI
ncbi:MAG: CoA-acylating methylmalonate-semialdehyde dehydrogenase [Johnsonella sp.]|nr:CoA-acylating methylmalonate-semialdehyde dehydrogenase [Johnsonella sp.]